MASTEVYATVDEMKARIDKTGTGDDAVLLALLTAASRALDNVTGREFLGFVAQSSATAREYTGRGISVQPIEECVEITKVEVKESPESSDYTEWSTDDWIAFRGDPEYPDFNNLPYTMLMSDPTGDEDIFTSGKYGSLRGFKPSNESPPRGVPTVRITAKWGYAVSVPEPIKEATIVQATIWYKRGESAWSDVLTDADFGEKRYVRALDPAVILMVKMGRYMLPKVG